MGTVNTHLGLAVGGIALIVAAALGSSLLPRDGVFALVGAGVLAIGLALIGLVVDGVRFWRRKEAPDRSEQVMFKVTGGSVHVENATMSKGESVGATESATDFSQGKFDHKRLRITDFPLDKGFFLTGKTFEHCLIEGPALLAMVEGNELNDLKFEGDPDNLVWSVPVEGKRVSCVIAVTHCAFRSCRLEKIGVVVPAKQVQAFKDMLLGKIRGFETDGYGNVKILP